MPRILKTPWRTRNAEDFAFRRSFPLFPALLGCIGIADISCTAATLLTCVA